METTRTFVAVELDHIAISSVQRVMRELKSSLPQLRWSRPEQMHVTLKFLGDVDNRWLPQVCEKVRQACASTPPFSLQLRGLGAFPKHKPPRVLWVGIDQGTSPLRELAQRLDESLAELGVPRETRLFTPHLTIARIGRGFDVSRWESRLDELSQQLAVTCEIDQVVLMASVKQPEGRLHEPIDTIELVD